MNNPEFLNFTFEDTELSADTFDELPLWSAPFGLLMLKRLELRPGLNILDIGSGSGFPIIELSERLGDTCKLYGLDPWSNANKRAIKKINAYKVPNVEIIEGDAEHIPFENAHFDLVISNLGINNFLQPKSVILEIQRVLKPGGRLAITSNLNGHWKEFYSVFYATLKEMGKNDLIPLLKKEEQHRGSPDSILKMFTMNGFIPVKRSRESFMMNFLNGSAFLNHHFIKLGWLGSWKQLFPADDTIEIFKKLEENLNLYSISNNGLSLTVPIIYIEVEKL